MASMEQIVRTRSIYNKIARLEKPSAIPCDMPDSVQIDHILLSIAGDWKIDRSSPSIISRMRHVHNAPLGSNLSITFLNLYRFDLPVFPPFPLKIFSILSDAIKSYAHATNVRASCQCVNLPSD